MINLINGSLQGPQENIIWADNKPSATVILNTHLFHEGEILLVGYLTSSGSKEIMIALGMSEGIGPSNYRIIIDKSVYVVTEVLESIPDVAYYAFNQIYLVRHDDDRELYLTRRYLDSNSGETTVESIKVEDKCVVIEASTGDIWVCKPPSLINFYDLTTRASIDDIISYSDGSIKVTVSDKKNVYPDLYLINQEEKNYLLENLFTKNFQARITSQKVDQSGRPTISVDPVVVSRTNYTLITTYNGNPVDLDIVPDGWTKSSSSIGVYTKTIPGSDSSSSGGVRCVYTIGEYTGIKNIASISTRVDKYVFIVYSPRVPTVEMIPDFSTPILTPTTSLGELTVTPPNRCYVWFCFPVSFVPSKITQLGLEYITKETRTLQGVTKDGKNLGNYIIYRSLNPGNGLSQDIEIR